MGSYLFFKSSSLLLRFLVQAHRGSEQRETDALFISYYLIELVSRNNVPDKEEGGIRIPSRSALCDRLCSWVGIALQRRC
jgi:hypothetical protein